VLFLVLVGNKIFPLQLHIQYTRPRAHVRKYTIELWAGIQWTSPNTSWA